MMQIDSADVHDAKQWINSNKKYKVIVYDQETDEEIHYFDVSSVQELDQKVQAYNRLAWNVSDKFID